MAPSQLQPRDSGNRLAVVRPPIPVHLIALPLLAIGIAAGYSVVLDVPLARWPALTVLAVAGTLSAAGYMAVRARVGEKLAGSVRALDSSAVALVLLTILGLALGAVDAVQWQWSRNLFGHLPYQALTLRVREGSSPTMFGGRRALAVVDLGDGATATVEVTHGEVLKLAFGQRVVVTGRTLPVRGARTANLAKGVVGRVAVSGRGAGSAQVAWQDGLVGWLGRIRLKVGEAIGQVPTEKEGRALLAGLLLGDRAGVREAGLEEPFRAAGVSHILSVSGSHLAVVAGAVMVASTASGIGRAWASLAVALFALGFTLLTGGDPATLRAWCMLVVASLVHHGGRRTDGLAAVGLAGIGLLLTDSGLTFSVGFWLSICAVAGLVLFTRYTSRWCGDLVGGGRLSRTLTVPLAATLAAQWSTMPITAIVFGAVSTVAPLTNLIVVPLTSIAIVVGLVGSVLLMFGLPSSGVLTVAGTISTWATGCTSLMSSIPGAEIAIGPEAARWWLAAISSLSLIAIYLAWPQPGDWRLMNVRRDDGLRNRDPQRGENRGSGRGAVLVSLVIVVAIVVVALWFAPSLGVGSRLVFLDVGQGDAILVQSGGRSVLIDGGPDEARLRWELLMAGCLRVDAVVATHDHDDHVAGLAVLANQLGGPPEMLYCASGAQRSPILANLASRYRGRIDELDAGSVVRIGELEARVLGPRGSVTDPGANDSCLVITIDRRGQTPRGTSRSGVLVGGDAEARAMLTAVRDSELAGVSVLKVGHHGSSDAVSAALLGALNPSLAVISVGEDNRYGHPAAETIEMLERAGVAIRRTDTSGRVVVRF